MDLSECQCCWRLHPNQSINIYIYIMVASKMPNYKLSHGERGRRIWLPVQAAKILRTFQHFEFGKVHWASLSIHLQSSLRLLIPNRSVISCMPQLLTIWPSSLDSALKLSSLVSGGKRISSGSWRNNMHHLSIALICTATQCNLGTVHAWCIQKNLQSRVTCCFHTFGHLSGWIRLI